MTNKKTDPPRVRAGPALNPLPPVVLPVVPPPAHPPLEPKGNQPRNNGVRSTANELKTTDMLKEAIKKKKRMLQAAAINALSRK